uniref:Uncharacterized protein n=1 Tax=Trypanosoma congolense (strain IL3000) TaxID=1068625 RepID=G0UKN4_TRYCI|nr:conserved hypothetical protein [Trypanosoma congolense IL3000]
MIGHEKVRKVALVRMACDRSYKKWTKQRLHALVLAVTWLLLLLLLEYRLSFNTSSRGTAGQRSANITLATDEERQCTGTFIRPREFEVALEKFNENLLVVEGLQGDPRQPSGNFTDVMAKRGFGVPVPYRCAPERRAVREEWEACDQRDADFTEERDILCQNYLRNIDNVRYIKAMSSRYLYGRTIKFKLRYAHNEIEAVVKVSQEKFYYEASSEVAAFKADRALNLSRVPTTVMIPLPVDYIRAASAFSPFFSQWITNSILEDSQVENDFIPCTYPSHNHSVEATYCTFVSAQLWMHDVHPTVKTFLALPYKFTDAFVKRYLVPGTRDWPPDPAKLRALGELVERFIFDFIIGNGDRGMNDHNNFAYGGCSPKTDCDRPPKAMRIKGISKYAFLDHGSSFYSHKDPKNNPFSGDIENITICRFRKKLYETMRRYNESGNAYRTLPFVYSFRKGLPKHVFNMLAMKPAFATQLRLEKVLRVVERCIKKYREEEVFSLPPYSKVIIPEEHEGLDLIPEGNYEEPD